MFPSPCANGCGFYGSATTKNLCSKCYHDDLKQNVIKSLTVLSLDDTEDGVKLGATKNTEENKTFEDLDKLHSPLKQNCSSSKNSISDDIGEAISLIESTNSNKKKNRCKSCNKKVGLIGFKCRCGDLFCGMHRYPEVHACEVDLKEIGRKVLETQNSLCIGDKLEYRI